MRRMIVHSEPDHVMGGEVYYRRDKYRHDPELLDAYECGRKDAYREIMEEQYGGSYNHREHMGRTMPPMMRESDYPMHEGRPTYREDFREPYPDEIEYRRRRAANGRYM